MRSFARAGRTASALGLAALLWSVTAGAAPADAATDKPPLDGPFAGNFILFDPAVPAPTQRFTDLDGVAVGLDAFAGRVVLVNFWATWCAPCLKEMPDLDRLQARLGARGFDVLALSVDRAGARAVAPFVERLGLEHLGIYLDPKGELAEAFEVRGLPSSFLIDARGRVVGGMLGAAPWDGPEAVRLIEHYLTRSERDPATRAGSDAGG